MKKILTLTIAVILLLYTVIFNVSAQGNVAVYIDGTKIEFDVQPQIINGRTLVPMRKIFEKLGAVVDWDNSTQTAMGTKENTVVKFSINDYTMYKDEFAKALDVPAQLIDGRTLIPLRAVSEAFDCQVGWDGNTSTISIISDFENYTMLYAPNDRSKSFPTDSISKQLAVGWYKTQSEAFIADKTVNNSSADMTIIEDCQDISRWTITNTTENMENVDTNSYVMGNQSLRCDGKMVTTSNVYDLTKNNLVLKLKVNSLSSGASIMLDLKTAGKAPHAMYRLVIGNSNTTFGEWYEIAIPTYVYSYADSNVDFSNISSVQINVSSGTGDWNLQYIGIQPRQQKKAIISFTFDDGYKSQYLGAEILAEKGISSTIYHIPNNGTDCLTAKECREMIANFGTDFEAHGPTNYTKLTDKQLTDYWTKTKQYFKKNGLGDCKHLAYPNGGHNEHIIELAKDYGFVSARTINGNIFAETQPPVDNYRLRAITGIGDTGVSVEKVKSYIDRAVTDNAWIILVFHQIVGDGENGCTESELRELADYAIASGADIMNIAEVFDSGIFTAKNLDK